MNLYSREEITDFNTKIQELVKKMAELDKSIKELDVDIKAEGNDSDLSNMKKIQMNKTLEKEEIMIKIKNLKKKISATA